MKFSVLMSTYYKEKPAYFDRTMQSIWDEQSVKPDEIVLVQNGLLTGELYQVIEKWQGQIGDAFKTLPLKVGGSLGNSLNVGLSACSHGLVARMDTDDVALPHRFEKQLAVFKNSNIDVCGSWIGEFESDENEIISYRKVPEQNKEIIKFAQSRCPVNHPASMYKKEAVTSVGNYPELTEDYNLWVKMIVNGAIFYNIQESLVSMRAGHKLLERRSGLQYAINDIKLQYEFLKIGFVSPVVFLKNLAIRVPARLMPKDIFAFIYRKIRQR